MNEPTIARWALRRLAFALVVVSGVTVLTFVLIHAAPGDPVYILAGDGGDASYYAEMRAKYGLDRPVTEQFVRYARAVGSGDFGYSFMYQAPVARVIVQHAPASLLLGLAALGIATTIGLTLGVAMAVWPRGVINGIGRLANSLAYSAPVFWTGQVLIIVVALKWQWLPAGGLTTAREQLAGVSYVIDVARHLVLPAVALACPFAAVVATVTRAAVLDALREPFILAAAARGVPRRSIVTKHALANAIVPVVALIGEHAGAMVAGAALTEALFGWPGLGFLVTHASLHRDYPLVTAAFIVISVGVVVANAVTDILCARLDRRISLT